MKKVLFLLVAGGLGYRAWQRYQAANADRDMWSKVTEPLNS